MKHLLPTFFFFLASLRLTKIIYLVEILDSMVNKSGFFKCLD
jgi:hypothetical protein